ncbi:hypothetical protein GBN33_16640 [Plesiomonas shigelloides]|uniref:hypothetical protein n=1 Tax=Plesiomonas shigelloides TaxID=703 RepID=UPI0012615F84|nr:hypothetical protein [Plesiomonas shigelloides]KAB7694292.1 hypothetical protein GBN33_16640 [Plesiomonas shigelloides]
MDSKPNYYVRTLIAILGLSILGMAYISFFLAIPKHQITAGIITLISIVVILVLSESFNKLSLGKIISLSREIEKKEKENSTVKNENKELRHELFKIVSNVQQSQVNNTFNTPPEAWLKLLGVVKAEGDGEDDCDSIEESAQAQAQKSAAENRAQEHEEARARSRLRRYAVNAGLKKFVSKLPLSDTQFVERVEFSSAFHAIDPIMDKRVVFDGYLKQNGSEVFVQARHSNMISFIFFDQLYIMLSKINLYREAKNTKAELLLLLVKTEWYENDERRNMYGRFIEYFQPAIKNGLLRIEYIDVSEEEARSEECGYQGRLF